MTVTRAASVLPAAVDAVPVQDERAELLNIHTVHILSCLCLTNTESSAVTAAGVDTVWCKDKLMLQFIMEG